MTRTRDPYVPNVVRYQLRHFSVRKILSPDVSVGVVTSDKKNVGVLENDAEFAASGRCLMSYIAKSGTIKKGDLIITSGSSVFPSDIVVGAVSDVFSDANGLTKHAVIEPSEDVISVTHVFVITDFEERHDSTAER